jgi:glucose-1-phosphate cytidylyltransferase
MPTLNKPKVVILAGGMGMRLKEETEYKPKPMIHVGPYPMLWHIMKAYMSYGFNDFVIALGFKGEVIKDYFLNYEVYNNDISIDFGNDCIITTHKTFKHEDFKVTLVNTGQETLTGGRVNRLEKYIDTENFMLTYGDGVSDVNIKKLYDFHLKHGKVGTVTGVHPESRFGELVVKGSSVVDFSEKPQIRNGQINGGFFVFKKKLFDYIVKRDCYFEREPMHKLSKNKQLNVYTHEGFWQCMDTPRDLKLLNDLWAKGKAPWKVWK